MSALLAQVSAAAVRLRVAIAASDPQRRGALAALVAAAGHDIALSDGEADAVLADAEARPGAVVPVVSLGGNDPTLAGVLPRDADGVQIDAALRAVAAGLRVRANDPAAPGFEAMADHGSPLLTPRELEILAAIGSGLSNKSVARQLGISPHTVKFHVESLFRKLGAVSRADAVARGLRQQIIDL